jgi:hypothetical protein
MYRVGMHLEVGGWLIKDGRGVLPRSTRGGDLALPRLDYFVGPDGCSA